MAEKKEDVEDVIPTTEHTEDEEDNSGPRKRKMTPKGLEYALQSKQKRLEQLCRALNKTMEQIYEMVDDDEDENDIHITYRKWTSRYGDFWDVHAAYCDLLTREDQQEYLDNWFLARNEDFIDFKKKMDIWSVRHVSYRDLSKIDTASNAPSHKTNKSSSTKSSSKEGTVISAKAEAEKKRAELRIKVECLKKRKQLEQQKLDLKMQEEEIKLEEEIALSEVHVNVLDKIRDSKDNRTSASRSESGDTEAALRSIVHHLKKPSTEVKMFGGNPLDYHRFMRQFKTRVLANCDDFDEKLDYLEQYTTGDANKIVTGYSYLKPETGYKAALKELENRYGDADIIVNAFIKKALSWPIIKMDNPKALDDFAIFLAECEHAVQDLDAMKVLEYTDNFRKIVSKLPYALHDKWRSLVQNKREKGKRPSFSHLVSFVNKEAKKSNDPTFGREAMSSDVKDQGKRPTSTSAKPQRPKGSFATKMVDIKDDPAETSIKTISSQQSPPQTVSQKQSAFTAPCVYCKEPHTLEFCQNLPILTYYDRTAFLKSKGYCFGCLKYGHQRKFCRNKATCNHCKGRHPTVLHVDGKLPPRPDVKQETSGYDNVSYTLSASASLKGAGNVECTMAIIPVKARLSGSSEILTTYAFLDPGSNISFCTTTLMNQLGAEGKRRKLTMDTMGVPHSMHTYEVPNIEILDLDQQNTVQLPTVYTKDRMPVSKTHIPTSADIQQWSHLKDIDLPQVNKDVGLLIGNNVPDAYAPIETRVGPRGTPHASRTMLGWIPWNVLREGPINLNTVNRADVVAIECAQELEHLSKLYIKSVNMDFPEKSTEDKKENSVQDQQFLEKMSKSQTYVDGHYQYCLPFKEQSVVLPDNQFTAKQRLSSLQKRLQKDTQLHEEYKQFMQTLIDQHYAEEVPILELQRADGKVWYVPHHGVYHAKKGKLRVVFDCSSKYKGVSLNDALLQGPDLTTSLIGVLMRFRQEETAIMGDIAKMFYQVLVPKEDRDCLRFYWWPNGNLQAVPSVYRMVVHLFGAVSSPSCSSYALHRTIQENKHLFDPSIIALATSSFYVDDFLCSVSKEEDAIAIVRDITSICGKGGFHITKWMTNSKHVLKSIPEQDRGTKLADFEFDPFPTDRALGVLWNMETDCLGFQIAVKPGPATRRNILSVVSSVYDPHGLAAPFVLLAKILLQDLCKRAIDWDTPLSDSDLTKWKQWLNGLPDLQNIHVPRCLKPTDSSEPYRIELHHFSDASEVGYGTASYLRIVDANGTIHCTLLFGKSRVAPLKKITIPRMELAAATLAVKMNNLITTELRYHINCVYFWTDSMAVLRYIANETTRFQTFIANRLTVIREGSNIDQWHFIEGTSNPADFASRGLQVADTKFSQWLEGPAFLHTPEQQWSRASDCDMDLPNDDPEVKKSVNAAIEQKPHILDSLISRYSNLTELIRVIAWILKYKRCLRNRVQNRNNSQQNIERDSCRESATLTTDLLEEAERVLVMHVQHQYFHQEMSTESPSRENNKHSQIYKLDPFIQEGVLRVGGRLNKACLPYDAKHQILIPKQSPLAKLMLQQVHKVVGHQGKNAMLSKLREKYWIPQASTLIKGITTKCVVCRKYSAKACSQKMSDLPKDRVVSDKAPFSHTGMDYFGPFYIKRGRATVKRYGVIFTCFASRAVHLEVAYTLDTSSCINAIRRFKSRRGQVKSITSDNGTNLVGAKTELRQSIDEWNQSKITKSLQQDSIAWHFNPPTGSHFGGVWERLIRSVRKVLYSLLVDHASSLDDESLQTLMCEVEHILNNRPITPVSDNVRDLDALTPNDLLLLKPDHGLPPGLFDSGDNYTRRRWRQVQYLANVFWRRWLREYLPLLQHRQKWNKAQRNLAVGDIVLLVENASRSTWPLGKVLNIHRDSKGLVRVVTVKTSSTTLQRPVDKLCLILETDLD